MKIQENEISNLCGLLKRVQFFSELSLNEIDLLIKVFEKEKFKRGKNIIKEGTTGDCLYIISDGRVSVWINKGFMSKKLVAYLSQGQYFGEMALLDDQIRKANVITDTDCEFYTLYRDKFWGILMNNPGIEEKIRQTFENRKKDTGNKQSGTVREADSPSYMSYRFKQRLGKSS